MEGTKRPWLRLYQDEVPPALTPAHPDAISMFRAAVARAPARPLVRWFGRDLTTADVDAMSDAVARALQDRGVAPGDRVALYLQNVPQFAIAVLAAWKAGAIPVPVNPMWKERELRLVLDDSGAVALIALESLHAGVASRVLDGTAVRVVLTTSELDLLGEVPPLLAGAERVRARSADDLLAVAERHAGARPDPVPLPPDQAAFLTYTSGTTGPPKGAINTHANVVFNAHAYREWMRLGDDDSILGIAPLFHITGLVGHLALALLVPIPLVLGFRFDAPTIGSLVERYRPTFTVGAITAFVALMNDPSASSRDLSSLRVVYSGGAPIAPPIVDEFERRTGAYIHNIYGLTETTSPSHAVPLGMRAPVDPASGALSVGIPIFDTVVRIVGDDGAELPPGEIGELVTEGPQVVPGYWNKPEESARAIRDGRLHTGDVGFMDDDGWFYIVDRKKDMIIASGYKVWPREVEDVLYQHPAVREAAVVGVPDEYRGETVKAFVSLKPRATAGPDELVAFCKERMAAYKYPRIVEILDELPKTVTGKILRRELRDR